jgi:hypothetical protein
MAPNVKTVGRTHVSSQTARLSEANAPYSSARQESLSLSGRPVSANRGERGLRVRLDTPRLVVPRLALRPSCNHRTPKVRTNGHGADAIMRLQALATRLGFPLTLGDAADLA